MAIASQRFVASRKILEVCGCYAVYSNRRGVRICRLGPGNTGKMIVKVRLR